MAKKHNFLLSGLLTVSGAAATSFIVSEHFFKLAFKRVNYVPETSEDKKKYAKQYYEYVDWFHQVEKERWTFTPDDGDGEMSAYFIPAADFNKDKAVVIAHGYKGNGETMSSYAKMYHDMGYNVLLPDDRAHGLSAGRYISFGWLDRLDYQKWLERMIVRLGEQVKILLFGVSMGGATVEMLSGDELPPQVKCIIADCGYSSIKGEMTYLLKNQYHLPEYPIYPLVSTISRYRLGFYLGDVSSVEQLAKNKLPIFIIHGANDKFVPSYMAIENYRATNAPKKIWIVDNASHAESFWIDPANYQKRISKFLDKYFH
ncbi:MAG: alpha/beta hydrolase [Limosilactobacillus sp.]|uniref:alpha/beta hydrolase n=1 Tax=Limosilactobacillus sp. TaxID=2773925 RepID=UPI0026F7D5D4|nr:alpha/beta hydrolase [Limosilactobacillus sp.]